MGWEYRIRFDGAASASLEALRAKLPDAGGAGGAWPAYEWKLEPQGFYFLDHTRSAAAAVAFRVLVDEGLAYGARVTIEEI